VSAVALRFADTDADIGACFAVLHQLRPHIATPAELVARVQRQRGHGYRLLAAWRDAQVVGAAGYRMQENLIHGRFVYVDDLVVLDRERRSGIGAALLDAVAADARADGRARMTLDTGLDNALGQRFYFRWGLLATGLHFSRGLA
jgi:ribosomal protein S18 acetylase RimI-like enzyme